MEYKSTNKNLPLKLSLGITAAALLASTPALAHNHAFAQEIPQGMTFYSARPSLADTPANWMGIHTLNEQTIGSLAIPGTHDSASYTVRSWWAHIAAGYAKTQDIDIEQQLHKGIRYFDFRTREDFNMYHGPVQVGGDLTTHFMNMKKFLDAHPGEFIIVRLKNENGNREQLTERLKRDFFQNTASPLYSYFARDVDFNRSNVGDVRGKIVIINNIGENLSLNEPYWNFISGQDNYEPSSVDEKWERIVGGVNWANQYPNGVFVNHLSYTYMPKFLRSLADEMNNRFYSYLDANHHDIKNLGIIAMDFPTDKVIQEILLRNRFNFKYQPKLESITLDKGTPLTLEEIKSKVQIPENLIERVDIENVPITDYALNTRIKTTVYYKDGTNEDVYIPLTINETDTGGTIEELNIYNYDAQHAHNLGTLKETISYRVPQVKLTIEEKLALPKGAGSAYQSARDKILKAFIIATFDISPLRNLNSLTGSDLVSKAINQTIEPRQEYRNIFNEPQSIRFSQGRIEIDSYSQDGAHISSLSPLEIVVTNDINNNQVADEKEVALIQEQLAKLKEDLAVAQEEKNTIEADGLVTQTEYNSLHAENDRINKFKEYLLEKVHELPELPIKSEFTNQIEQIRTSDVVVNDANENGRDDALEAEEAALLDTAQGLIDNFEKALKAALDKKADIESDTIVSAREKEELDGLIENVRDARALAENLVNALPQSENKDALLAKLQNNPDFNVVVNDANNNNIKDAEEVEAIRSKLTETENIVEALKNLIKENEAAVTEDLVNQVRTGNTNIDSAKAEILNLINALPHDIPEKEELNNRLNLIETVSVPEITPQPEEPDTNADQPEGGSDNTKPEGGSGVGAGGDAAGGTGSQPEGGSGTGAGGDAAGGSDNTKPESGSGTDSQPEGGSGTGSQPEGNAGDQSGTEGQPEGGSTGGSGAGTDTEDGSGSQPEGGSGNTQPEGGSGSGTGSQPEGGSDKVPGTEDGSNPSTPEGGSGSQPEGGSGNTQPESGSESGSGAGTGGDAAGGSGNTNAGSGSGSETGSQPEGGSSSQGDSESGSGVGAGTEDGSNPSTPEGGSGNSDAGSGSDTDTQPEGGSGSETGSQPGGNAGDQSGIEGQLEGGSTGGSGAGTGSQPEGGSGTGAGGDAAGGTGSQPEGGSGSETGSQPEGNTGDQSGSTDSDNNTDGGGSQPEGGSTGGSGAGTGVNSTSITTGNKSTSSNDKTIILGELALPELRSAEAQEKDPLNNAAQNPEDSQQVQEEQSGINNQGLLALLLGVTGLGSALAFFLAKKKKQSEAKED